MKMGNTNKFYFFLLLSILLVPIIDAQSFAASWVVFDQINDVKVEIQGLSPPYELGDFHDEIDIVKLELVDEQFNLTFQDKPIKDLNYSYSLTVFWNDENTGFDVWTFAMFNHSINLVELVHLDENSNLILEGREDIITISGNSLLIPIVNYTIIEDPFSTYICTNAVSTYNENSTHSYKDRMSSSTISMITSQVGSEIPITSTIALLMLSIIYLKKKK